MINKKILMLFLFPFLLSKIYAICPYGQNSWQFAPAAFDSWTNAGILSHRVMCDWGQMEPQDNQYNWSANGLTMCLTNAPSNADISLCIYGKPSWADIPPGGEFAYNPAKLAEFITALLQYADSVAPGKVKSVEIDNEGATGYWTDSPEYAVTHGTEWRDVSLAYANILKVGYQTVKAYNPNLLVIMTGMLGAIHTLDDLYQMGCKGYFDRINIHFYTNATYDQQLGKYPDEADPSFTGAGGRAHFPTTIKYLEYLANVNDDPGRKIWVTEFGFRFGPRGSPSWGPPQGFPDFEIVKSTFMHYVMDMARKSAIVDYTCMYIGITGGWTNQQYDSMGLIYCDNDSNPTIQHYTTSYYMYQKMSQQYPVWNNQPEPIPVIPGASRNVQIDNPGFESGSVRGWEGDGISVSTVSRTGRYSGKTTAPHEIRTQFYNVEPGKLYEVVGYVKVDSTGNPACMVMPYVISRNNGSDYQWWAPPSYWGIVNTSRYPGGWRRVRFAYAAIGNEMCVQFQSNGTGTIYVDDFSINALHFTTAPVLSVNTSILNFGDVKIGEKASMCFEITNIGGGTLSGNITSDKNWIKVTPGSFNSNSVLVNVTVDNEILGQIAGDYSGNITINSNGGNSQIDVNFSATCVLTRPNPCNIAKDKITFYGSGIVPENTEIKIWTISGELVKTLNAGKENEIIWDGKDKDGKDVSSGIYIYTFKSSKEKGINKFTLIR